MRKSSISAAKQAVGDPESSPLTGDRIERERKRMDAPTRRERRGGLKWL